MVDYKYPPLKKGKKPKSGCRKLLELAAVVFLFGAVFVVIVTVSFRNTPPSTAADPDPYGDVGGITGSGANDPLPQFVSLCRRSRGQTGLLPR